MYIDIMLNQFNMENFKRGYLSIGHGIILSKNNYSTTPDERERMTRIPYASIVGSIMHAMTCMKPDVADSLGV